MSTRLYFGQPLMPFAPTVDSSWEASAARVVRPLVTSKQAVNTSFELLSVATTLNSPAGAVDICMAQYVSPPLDGVQVISGAIKGQLRADESNAAADLRMQCVIRVITEAGTVRGTLIASDTAALSSEWAVTPTLTNRKFPRGAPITPTSVTAQHGDRIVVEIGYRKHENATTSRTGRYTSGNWSSVGDFPEDETDTTGLAPWIEFANTLVFQTADYPLLAGTSGSTAGQGAGAGVHAAGVPAQAIDGDLLLLYIEADYGTITDPSGWLRLGSEISGSGTGAAIWGRIASSEPASYNVTIPVGSSAHVMQAYRPTGGTWSSVGDAILAVRTHDSAAPAGTKPDTLMFQSCYYVAAGFASRTANVGITVPTGWTTAGATTGVGAGGSGATGGWKAFGGEGLDGAAEGAWSSGARFATVAIRNPGNNVLALSSFVPVVIEGITVSSLAIPMPATYRAGDLVCVIQACRDQDPTAPTFGTPSGWSKHATDQQYVISAVGGSENNICTGLIYKIVSGSEGSVTITTNETVERLHGYALCFSTGPTGPDPRILGTMGQANDTTSNTTVEIPAASVEDYAQNNILVAGTTLQQGDYNLSAANGWDMFVRRNDSVAGSVETGWFTKLPLNSGADPAASSVTSSNATVSQAIQFAVGSADDGLLGTGRPEVFVALLG